MNSSSNEAAVSGTFPLGGHLLPSELGRVGCCRVAAVAVLLHQPPAKPDMTLSMSSGFPVIYFLVGCPVGLPAWMAS